MDPVEAPPIPRRVRKAGRTPSHDRNPHDRIDDLEDEVVDLRERMSANEAATKGLGKSVDGLRGDIQKLYGEILKTFGRLFLALILVVIIAIGSISAIVGGTVYLSGGGVALGTGRGHVERP